MGAERERIETFGSLENGLQQASAWYMWGPYLSERQWGTVREDYSPDGEAWSYLPHERSEEHAVDVTLEYSRPFRALKLWLAFRAHGAAAFRQAIERLLRDGG